MNPAVKFALWCVWNLLIWSVIPMLGLIGYVHVVDGDPAWGWPLLIFSVVNILVYMYFGLVGHVIREVAGKIHEKIDPTLNTRWKFAQMTQEQIDAIMNFDPVTGEPLPTKEFVHASVPELRNGHKYYRMFAGGEPDDVYRFGKLVKTRYEF